MIDKRIFKIIDKKIMKRLVGISVLQALFVVIQGILLSNLVVQLYYGKISKLWYVELICFALAFIFRNIMKNRAKDFGYKLSKEKGKELKESLSQQIMKYGLYLRKEGSGKLALGMLDGIHNIENYILLITVKIIDMMSNPVIILLAILYFDWISALILLVIMPISIVFMALFGLAAKKKADRQFKGYQALSSFFMDSMQGIETLKIIGQEKEHAKNVFKMSEGYRHATMATLRIALLSTFTLDFFTTLSIAIVAVFLGVRLISGNIQLYNALVVLVLSPEYFLPLRQFAEDYHATLNGKNALDYIEKIQEMHEPESKDYNKFIDSYNENSSVKLNNISFAYDNNKEILRDITLEAGGYSNIGIIGGSGAGKTTLLNVIAGFIEPKGSCQVNGVELQSLMNKSWQSNIIYIPQDPYIFSASILENISIFNNSLDEIEAIKICERVGLGEILQQLPEGVRTQIGEKGRELSGGEKQRIALARAFACPSRKILIFDEVAAHLDIETEYLLKAEILELCKNRLVFFSTHRLHWLKNMDYILVLDKGKIIARGSYEEIIRDSNYIELSKALRGDCYE